MQKSSAIFAIAILLLSLSPCADAWSDDDCQEHLHITQSTDGQHPEGDTCTPFCSCACCRVSVQSNDLVADFEPLSPITYRPEEALEPIISPPFSIWQPPKV